MGIGRDLVIGGLCFIAGVSAAQAINIKYDIFLDKVGEDKCLIVENRDDRKKEYSRFYRVYFGSHEGRDSIFVEKGWGPYSENREKQ